MIPRSRVIMMPIKLLFAFLILIPSLGWSANLTCEENLLDPDTQALSALEQVVLNLQGHRSETSLWLAELRKHAAGETELTIHEHTALAYIVKIGYFKDLGDHQMQAEAETLLRKSWLDRTGKIPADISQRLPVRVLWGATREERVFHSASFQTRSVPKSQEELSFDYIPTPGDLVGASLVAAMAFSETGASILAASMLGYATSSTIEHLIHRYSGHAPKRLREVMKKMAWFGRSVLRAEFSHARAHHLDTFKTNFVTQFASAEAKAEYERKISELDPWYAKLKNSRYGLSLSSKGIAIGLAIATPVYAALAYILDMNSVEIAAFAPSAALYVAASAAFHPYIHLRRSEALAKASPPMRWFLKTRYAENAARAHYGHHLGRGGNFNLVMGADFFFGQLRQPNLHQLFKMRQLQVIGSVFDAE